MQAVTQGSMVATADVPNSNDSQTQADTESAGSSKRQKSRHRASVACATCRERRIRVCQACSSSSESNIAEQTSSVSSRRAAPNAFNAPELEPNASLRMTMNEGDQSPEPI